MKFELADTFVEILPEWGCAIQQLQFAGKTIIQSEEVIPEIGMPGYHGCFLFPFPNRLADGILTWNYSCATGKLHQHQLYFPVNEPERSNALHGVWTNRIWKMISMQRELDFLQVCFEDRYEGEYSAYPFPMILQNEFRLEPSSLTVTTRIQNQSDILVPAAIGWHPYFYLQNDPVAFLKIDLCRPVYLDEWGRANGTGAFLQSNPFIIHQQLDHRFEFRQLPAKIQMLNNKKHIKLQVELLSCNFPYRFVQIYVPPSKNSIAIEPMTCPPNGMKKPNRMLLPNGMEITQSLWRISQP